MSPPGKKLGKISAAATGKRHAKDLAVKLSALSAESLVVQCSHNVRDARLPYGDTIVLDISDPWPGAWGEYELRRIAVALYISIRMIYNGHDVLFVCDGGNRSSLLAHSAAGISGVEIDVPKPEDDRMWPLIEAACKVQPCTPLTWNEFETALIDNLLSLAPFPKPERKKRVRYSPNACAAP